MKRSILSALLALALILLAGCGGNAATATPVTTPEASAEESLTPTPTPAATPAPTPTPTPIPTPESTPNPDRIYRDEDDPVVPVAAGPVELPDVGFEAASMWYASGFGDGGRAFLFLGEPQGETMDVALYMCQYYYEPMDSYEMCHFETWSERCTASPDGDGWRFELDGFSVYVEPDVAELTIYYSNPDGDPNLMPDTPNGPTRVRTFNWGGGDFTAELFYPDRFGYVSPETSALVWCAMPMFAEEIEYAIPMTGIFDDLTARFGEENLTPNDYFDYRLEFENTSLAVYTHGDSEERYTIACMQTDDPRYAPTVRGTTIGCSYIDALSRFTANPTLNRSETVIYGGSDMVDSYGLISFYSNELSFGDGHTGERIEYYFNEEGLITSVAYFSVS